MLAHARLDGETFGSNVAEAMIHGRPVVSHRSHLYNAQVEIIADTGFVVGQGDAPAYAAITKGYFKDAGLDVELTTGGAGVFGAHVVAIDAATGTMVGGFSLDAQGDFSIGALSPGPHLLRVEPLDDVDVDSFFDNVSAVDVNFQIVFLDRVIIVPSGADSGIIPIAVVAK